jgi:hypothetical protein
MTPTAFGLPQTIFGVSRGLEYDEIRDLVFFFRRAWQAQYGREPSTLTADLERLADVFRSHASPKRLRAAATRLKPVQGRPAHLSPDVFIPVDELRGFVTPEGRVLLEHLSDMMESEEALLSRDAVLHAYATVGQLYGEWQRDWITRQLTGAGLRPGTYGFVVTLLINGSVGQERALRLPADQALESELATKVMDVANTFAVGIGGSPTKGREMGRLRSNWVVTEASRQLYGKIMRPETDRSCDAYIWIDASKEFELVDELGARLAERKGLDSLELEEALEATRRAYRLARPALVSWGLCHERTSHTDTVVNRLVDSFIRSEFG